MEEEVKLTPPRKSSEEEIKISSKISAPPKDDSPREEYKPTFEADVKFDKFE